MRQNAGIFKSSKAESKAERTSDAAWSIVNSEAAKRAAKTERLRAARLARDSEMPAGMSTAKTAKRKK